MQEREEIFEATNPGCVHLPSNGSRSNVNRTRVNLVLVMGTSPRNGILTLVDELMAPATPSQAVAPVKRLEGKVYASSGKVRTPRE